MNTFWPFVRSEVHKQYLTPEQYEEIVVKQKIKYALHTIFWSSLTLPKRIELGDAHETNIYHLFFYMLARFYYFDDGTSEIKYYYPNKYNNYISEQAFACLPSRFKREFTKSPEYEYLEMPACCWYATLINESWIYQYVRDLYKHIWESVPQTKGKYTYISRNARQVKGRRILNEDELVEPLKREGFSTYTLEHMSFEDQIRLFRSSEIITGSHGAGLTWLIFCFPQTLFLEIGLPGGETNHREHYEHIAASCNLLYYRYPCAEIPEKEKYPDAQDQDSLLNIRDFIISIQAVKHLKKESKQTSSLTFR